MTRHAKQSLDALSIAIAQRATQTESNMHRYSPEAVQRAIDRDKRIKPAEAKLIHALLRGRN